MPWQLTRSTSWIPRSSCHPSVSHDADPTAVLKSMQDYTNGLVIGFGLN